MFKVFFFFFHFHFLFDLLFPPGSEIYDLLGRNCEWAVRHDRVFRLKLQLHNELSNLPWEAMERPQSGSWAEPITCAQISIAA